MKASVLRQINELNEKGKISAYPPASLSDLKNFVDCKGVTIHKSYMDLLSLSNGLETSDGYFRIFGIGNDAKIDALNWNSIDTWKFAWPERVRKYWCFAETAVGDQYAFDSTMDSCQVYLLSHLTMMAECLEENFEDFLTNEFFRNAIAPYDPTILSAKKRFGTISGTEILSQSPSVLVTGVEDANSMIQMPRTAAMIANGDLCTQLIDQPQSNSIRGVEPVQDSKGRMRLRVVWAAMP